MEVNSLVVAVDERLEELKDGLKKKGYHVVSFLDHTPIDAIVYYQDGKYTENKQAQMSYSFGLLGMEQNFDKVFLINGYDKTVEEIDQMLQKRTYSPLFKLE